MTANTAVSPALTVLLCVFGIAGLFLGAWFSTIDTALSRMTLAYAEDLVAQGKRGSRTLARAVAQRKETGGSLAPARVLATTLGMVVLSVALSARLWTLGWTWWATIGVTLLVVGLAQLLALWVSTRLNAGSGYVSVALWGSALALKAPGRAGRTRRANRQTGGDATTITDQREARLAVADELREILDEVSDDGTPAPLEEEDRRILRSVFELGQTRVGELMVPRSEMVTVKADELASVALEVFLSSGYSRLPVVGKSLDDIRGVLYLKDVVRRSVQDDGGDATEVQDMARAASFVPEMKLANDELRVMQSTNTHLAMVVDEYGGIAGLVTAEDILEELVGELVDEHDVDVATPEEISPGRWRIPTSLHIDDLADLLDVRIDEDEVYSAGGLLTKATGKIPLPGDTARVGDILLEADASVGRRKRVLSLVVQRAAQDTDTTESANLTAYDSGQTKGTT